MSKRKSKVLFELHYVPRSTGRSKIYAVTALKRNLVLAIAVILIGGLLFLIINQGMDELKLIELNNLREENSRLHDEMNLVIELERELAYAEDIEGRLRQMLGEEVAASERAEAENALLSATPYIPGEELAEGEFSEPGEGFSPTDRTGELAAAVAASSTLSTPQGWPLRGWVTRGFTASGDNRHLGIDIASDIGNPVKATASGVVVFAAEDQYYGWKVVIVHPGGFSTIYGHNDKLFVSLGERVERGDRIALSGNSGASTAPHLHYELRRDDVAIDPMPFLE